MAAFERKKQRQTNIISAIITAFLVSVVFLALVGYFYKMTEDEAYENLHRQTKQIKDDMQLQIISDRENLETMAGFAAKLYADGESYDIMFESFEPIGLIANIGILNPDGMFYTKAGELDLADKISFSEEKAKGSYVTGRVKDLTRDNYEIIRSAVPITVDNEVVGILYGVIKLDVIGERYGEMAKELDAQLFVYDNETGNLVIDTINDELTNISILEDREYNDGYSYEDIIEQEKGYTSFVSIRTGEDLYVHYSSMDSLDWTIMLARYETQVFANAHKISRVLLTAFSCMLGLMALYTFMLMIRERSRVRTTTCASNIRRLLLEINQHHNNLTIALKEIATLTKSRSTVFFDLRGEDNHYFMPDTGDIVLKDEDREYFKKAVLDYACEFYKTSKTAVSVMRIRHNERLNKINPELNRFIKAHGIYEVSFAAVYSKDNNISVLGAVNPKRGAVARTLLEDVAVCFSIAIYNKKHLNRTEIAATTDSLTGASNRVTYKKDLLEFDERRPEQFSCIYIDVNELHMRNNKYGHAAGDEMLIYIANSLREIFFDQYVYRMGGDEFLVFTEGMEQDSVKSRIESFIDTLKPMGYHVAIGLSYRSRNTDTEQMVKEAEVRMYEAKAQYYQSKEQRSFSTVDDKGYVQTKTGIREIDVMLSILKEHYNGIYRVSLNTDIAHRILMPAYLSYNEIEENFSQLFERYVEESVNNDYHRALMSFKNYETLRTQLLDGKVPQITFRKINHETVVLSVYRLHDTATEVDETLWVFAKG